MSHEGWMLVIESLRELFLLTTAGVLAIKWELIHKGEDPRPKIKRKCRECKDRLRRRRGVDRVVD